MHSLWSTCTNERTNEQIEMDMRQKRIENGDSRKYQVR